MKIEWEKKRIGIIILFDKPKPFFRDGIELVLFPPKGLPWYNHIIPYRYNRRKNDKLDLDM